MNHTTTWALYDELLKIAETSGDLVRSANVANATTLDGSPAKPFSRQRGYRRLVTQLDKEAGAFRDALRKLRAGGRLARMKTKKVGETVDRAATTVYVKSPKPVQKTIDMAQKVITDPDQTGTAATGEALKRLLGH